MPKKDETWLDWLFGGSSDKSDRKPERRSGDSRPPREPKESKWREKSCPGYDGNCGTTIRYNTDWENIPQYCPSCTQKQKKANQPHRGTQKQRQQNLSPWWEKTCPGVPGHTCHNIIRYRYDWENIPTHCDSCRNREIEKPCETPGCTHTIRYKVYYRDVPTLCGRCRAELKRGKQPRQCDRCHNVMFVAPGKDYKICRDCHDEEQVEKHKDLRRSVGGTRTSIGASSLDALAQALLGYANRKDQIYFARVEGAARETWKMPPMKRGEQVDRGFDRGNLPYNFPGIDAWDERTGEVTSVKSIDLGAETYRSLNALDRQIARYVCELANYDGNEGTRWQPEIKAGETKKRTLILVVPLITARDYQLNYLYSVNDAFFGRKDICKDSDQKPVEVKVRVVVFIVD